MLLARAEVDGAGGHEGGRPRWLPGSPAGSRHQKPSGTYSEPPASAPEGAGGPEGKASAPEKAAEQRGKASAFEEIAEPVGRALALWRDCGTDQNSSGALMS